MLLLITAIAPSLALLYYIYLRDKYNKEPRQMLLKAFVLGSLAVAPVILVEMRLDMFDLVTDGLLETGYTAFIVAGLVEEGFKYLIFWFFIWRNQNFDERYDGIVYSVFISLGFATTENVGYVLLSGGFRTAIIRSLTAVPAHALFGMVMGYYLGMAKFAEGSERTKNLTYALIIPIFLHGAYDFIIFSQSRLMLLLFVPYMVYLWRRGLTYVDELSERPRFYFRSNRNKQ